MQPHRSSALGYASAASAAHSRVYGACAAEAAASETSGLSVGGCIRAWADFRPYPVPAERGAALAQVEQVRAASKPTRLELIVLRRRPPQPALHAARATVLWRGLVPWRQLVAA